MTALVKNPDDIKIGIIGMTEGNGHPYSWSAMFNGYNKEAMTAECPFPVIPVYLNKENLATMGIPGAKVTMVYCDRRSDAEHVSKLSLVPTVVDSPEEMIGKVDAVIIATDIGSEHVRRAKPFLDAGIPLFIDKPLCDNYNDLCFFRKAIADGAKILSSSCMRYAKEYQPYHNRHFREVGDLRLITVATPKKWETYGIHALESFFPMTGPGFTSIRNTGEGKRNIVHIKHRDGFDVIVSNIYDMTYGGGLGIHGNNGNVTLFAKDSYTTFRNQLVAFVDYLRTDVLPFPFAETDELMQLVIGAIESRRLGGAEVKLPLMG